MSDKRIAVIGGGAAGMMAAISALSAGADVILVPEVKWSIDDVCHKLSEAIKHGKECSIIVLSEHVCDPADLAKMIQVKSGIECRSVILGHVQRGGDPSAFDRSFGTKCGAKCVDMLLQGECGAVHGAADCVAYP